MKINLNINYPQINNTRPLKNTRTNTPYSTGYTSFCGKTGIAEDTVQIAKRKYKLTARDMQLSSKVSSVLHELNEDSILVIGRLKSMYLKSGIKNALEKHQPKVNKENLKNIFVVNENELDGTFIIERLNDTSFEVVGGGKNLDHRTIFDRIFGIKYKPKQTVKYGETIELNEDKLRLHFINTEQPVKVECDGVYSADNLYSTSILLK